jgi:hypothetical protein
MFFYDSRVSLLQRSLAEAYGSGFGGTSVDQFGLTSDQYFSYTANDVQTISRATTSAWASTSTGSSQAASSSLIDYTNDAVTGSGGNSVAVTSTYQKTHNGKTSISNGTHTYSLSSTQTYAFSQNFATVGGSTLSGTAAATRTQTSTYTTSIVAPTTVYLYGGAFFLQKFYAGRGALPPLRGVQKAFGLTAGLSNGPHPVAGFSGEFAGATDSYSYVPFFSTETISNTIEAGTPPNTSSATLTVSYTSSWEDISATLASSTALFNLSPQAARRRLSGFLDADKTGELFSTYNLNPADLSAVVSFVPIFHHISQPLVFTSMAYGFSVDDSSASAQWIRTASQWSLRLTKANSSTSTTLWATISLSGATASASVNADETVGNSIYVLGPLQPVTYKSAHRISVTLADDNSTADSPHYFYSGVAGTSFSEGSSSRTASVSSTHELGSQASPWLPATYPESSLSFYKPLRGISISTNTATYSDRAGLSIPTFYQNSKWNEAGRNDAVSLGQ